MKAYIINGKQDGSIEEERWSEAEGLCKRLGLIHQQGVEYRKSTVVVDAFVFERWVSGASNMKCR